MRTLIVFAATALFSTAAFAGVLPITGKYCDMSGAGVIADANGVWSEDDAPFDRIVKSAPGWWEVSYKGDDYKGIVARISLSPDKHTITITDSDSANPIILHRCK